MVKQTNAERLRANIEANRARRAAAAKSVQDAAEAVTAAASQPLAGEAFSKGFGEGVEAAGKSAESASKALAPAAEKAGRAAGYISPLGKPVKWTWGAMKGAAKYAAYGTAAIAGVALLSSFARSFADKPQPMVAQPQYMGPMQAPYLGNGIA